MDELTIPDKEPTLTPQQREQLERMGVDLDALVEYADGFVPADNYRLVAQSFADDHGDSWRLEEGPSSVEEVFDLLEAAIWARHHGEL